jgi:5,5'-dehydrodivanillate O-demethylase oxygenase subunit
MRKRLIDDIERIERGEDPKAIVRDPARNATPIPLPVDFPEMIRDGLPLAELFENAFLDPRLGFTNQVGQPAWVRRQYLEAMGVDPDTEIRENPVLERMVRDRSKVAGS